MIYANAKRVGLVLSLLFVLGLICYLPVQAAGTETQNGYRTDKYVMQYLTIDVPEDYIVLDTSLKDADYRWVDAEINDPGTIKKEYESRGVVAVYFIPGTHSYIYFIQKKSDEALKTFDITEYSDDDLIAYAKKQLPEMEDTVYDVSTYDHPDMKMYRVSVVQTTDDGISEVIYGTIVNGMGIQFSMDDSRNREGLKEELLLDFINHIKLTTKMTREEYSARVRKTWITIGCFFGGGILLMVIMYIISKQQKKKKKKKIDTVSKKLYDFRMRRKDGKVDLTNIKYEVETDYDAKLIEAYSTYNFWFKNIKKELVMALIYVAFVGYATYLGSTFVCIVGITVAFLLLYFKFSGKEKFQDNQMKRYEIKKKKSVTAVYRFYDEFFTLSGIDSIAEYIYPQVFKMANYQGYLLLYISDDNALVIDVEKLPDEDRTAFINFIYEKSR
ncbi:MAG: hypothetical protein J5372_09755 [Lachnospiraceae bacterium]|nr:hypothetical protein [Lachnospiraceae bacterium]